jgi:hypothetical protein
LIVTRWCIWSKETVFKLRGATWGIEVLQSFFCSNAWKPYLTLELLCKKKRCILSFILLHDGLCFI